MSHQAHEYTPLAEMRWHRRPAPPDPNPWAPIGWPAQWHNTQTGKVIEPVEPTILVLQQKWYVREPGIERTEWRDVPTFEGE